jgi:hypothetical protein
VALFLLDAGYPRSAQLCGNALNDPAGVGASNGGNCNALTAEEGIQTSEKFRQTSSRVYG